jgi:hypothetical protein
VPVPAFECQLSGLAETQLLSMTDDECPPLRLFMDPRGDLAVLDGKQHLAFRLDTGATIAISADRISDRTAPPVGWTVGAGLGGSLGLCLYFVAQRIRRRAARIEGIEAEHLGLGTVRLPGGKSVIVAAAAALPLGAIVLTDPTERAPTYRLTGTPTFEAAFPGKLADLRAIRTDLAASCAAIALAAATLGATPLVVERVLGALYSGL